MTQKPFTLALYEAVLYAYGKAFAKYDPFAYEILIKEIGKELLDYLQSEGYAFSPTGQPSDLNAVVDFFVQNGFVQQLEVKPGELGHRYIWHGLLGQDAYERLQDTTPNPFLSCPLNAVMLYLAEPHGKTLKLYGKSFDRAQQLAESEEGLVDVAPRDQDFRKLPLEQDLLLKLAQEKTQRLETAVQQLQAESALRKTLLQRLADAQATAHLGSWHWDLITHEMQWSDEAFRLLGLEPNEQPPSLELVLSHVAESDRDEFRRRVSRCLEFQEAYSMEFKVVTAQGQSRYLHAKGKLTNNPQGVPAYFDGVALDITSRKKLESLLQFQSEITFHMGEGVQLTRCTDLQIVYTNPSFDRMFGYAPGELLGRPVSRLYADAEQHPFAPGAEALAQVQRKGQWQGEVRTQHKDGTLFWTLTTLSLFRHEEFGEVWIAVQTDITDRIARRMEVEQARQQAELANRYKSQFLASISHEVRTPLNSMLGFTELILSETGDPRHRELLQVVQASGQTLLELINQLLDLSKVEAGKMEIRLGVVNLNQLLRDLERELAPRAASAKLQFRVEAPALPLLHLDALRLKQVLSNLLVNAIKFTERGEVRLEVASQPGENQGLQLEFKVTDTGIGIPQDQLEKVFEPFVQDVTHVAPSLGGSGLGLSISQRLAELMGGQLTVTSELDQGSTFVLHLPQVQVAGVPPQPEAPPRAATVSLRGKRILVADDLAANRMLLGTALERAGAKVLYAEDGLDTLRQAKAHQPDLILLDLKMPRLDGLNAARALKQDPSMAHTPIVAVTADAFAVNSLPDFQGVLTKPVNLTHLVALVAQLVLPS